MLMKQRSQGLLRDGRNIEMTDDFKPAAPPDSMEFEDLEKPQSANPPLQQTQQPQKPQENFNVKDEVGQAMETAQQAVFGPTDPAKVAQQQMEQAKKKQDEQQKIVRIKTFLNQMAQDEQKLKQLRQEEQQKKAETQQAEEEQKQEEQIVKQKKEQSFQEEYIKAEQTKAERKLGVGG